ncbi:hypothetical protein MJO28_008783 [Puccinia striiformis f. sp. tritici]|uniref:Uncharacterized protein n=1 Tax=Puccinia striiformis f. sp. tritici TaxID=168172 RepID=A0ACC0EDQ2_9BASI|nr:hypothetical protein MJO28_008783 [Puccinia striiformis f. sp. tritici]
MIHICQTSIDPQSPIFGTSSCSPAKPETTSLYKRLRIVGRSHPAGIVVYTSYPTSRALCVSAFDILQVTGSIQVDNGLLHPCRLPPISREL